MPNIEPNFEQADVQAQNVMNDWGRVALTRTMGVLPDQFMALLDKAGQYQSTRRQANSFRRNGVLSEQVEAEEKATWESFTDAHNAYYGKAAGAS
jgi:hypothetical protein